MRQIKLHIYVFAFIFALGTVACVLFVILGAVSSGAPAYPLLAVMASVSVMTAVLCIRALGKLKGARLIAENPILHVRTAVISDLSDEAARPENSEGSEVFISYFGILLDAQIVKFNQDGIRLRAVEIGDGFIALTYGTKKRMQNIRLLRPPIAQAAMAEICERFRYETGITPTLLS